MSPVISLLARIRATMDVVYREILKFGAVGAVAYVVDVYVYNLMRTGVWPLYDAPLADKPLASKVVSVFAATIVAWLGNRYWTFRHRRRSTARKEFMLFVVMNVGGLAISLACLSISHYLLGLTSALADNISGNVIGLALGTLFRFWAYRQFVFTELRTTVPLTVVPFEDVPVVHDTPLTAVHLNPAPTAMLAAETTVISTHRRQA